MKSKPTNSPILAVVRKPWTGLPLSSEESPLREIVQQTSVCRAYGDGLVTFWDRWSYIFGVVEAYKTGTSTDTRNSKARGCA